MKQDACATLEEVGVRAGCSPATVSRVLNNVGSVSDAVRKSVLRVVEEVGYVPRRTPRSFRSQGCGLSVGRGVAEVILYRRSSMERVFRNGDGLHVDSSASASGRMILSESYALSADFYMHIISGITDELSSVGWRGLLQTTDDLASAELIAETNRPDRSGVLLLGEHNDDIATFIDACKHPLVLVDIISPGKRDVVTTDNMAGAGKSVQHLVELGHRDIGFVGANLGDIIDERLIGYQCHMAAAGCTVRSEWVYCGSKRIPEITGGVLEILRQKIPPTAFVCNNDWMALAVLRAAEQANINVPGELSVVGFDDIDIAAMVQPSLTTLHVPLQVMGAQAVRQLLMNRLFDESVHDNGCMVRLMPELVVRQSTGPVPANRVPCVPKC